MNYYSFHIGDYAAHTRHLSLMEDLAYRRLLDLYYLREGHLPMNCARLIGMQDQEEAVKAVLADFFEPVAEGWRHKRCDEELAKFQAMAEGGRKGAAKRWKEAPPCPGDSPPIAPPSGGDGEAIHPPSTPQCQPITKNQEPLEIVPSELVGNAADGPVPDPWRCPPCPHEELVRLYGEILPQLPRCIALNESRRSHLGARWRQVCVEEKFSQVQGLEWFGDFFRDVRKSRFLIGLGPAKDGRVWRADLDWLMNSTNFLKVVEGRYHPEAA